MLTFRDIDGLNSIAVASLRNIYRPHPLRYNDGLDDYNREVFAAFKGRGRAPGYFELVSYGIIFCSDIGLRTKSTRFLKLSSFLSR
jgi:hypothetical protein